MERKKDTDSSLDPYQGGIMEIGTAVEIKDLSYLPAMYRGKTGKIIRCGATGYSVRLNFNGIEVFLYPTEVKKIIDILV